MATLSVNNPTLLDLARVTDPDGSIAQIVEILNMTNEVLDDMTWQEGNLLTGHRSSIRAGLPAPTWRKLYGGVQPNKARSVQVTDSCGMLEAYAEVDKKLADLNGNSAAWRAQEESAFVEGFGQKAARYMIYGNEATEPESFTGLAPRFNDQSALNGENILTSGATPDNNDNTSIWLVVWGPNKVFGIYPKGSQAGLQIVDKGQVTIENIDGAGGRMEAYRTHFKWDIGMCVADWRYVVRINYDLEDVTESGTTGPVLANLMAKAMRRVPNLVGRPAFYMNRDSWDAFDLQANAKATLAYRTIEDAQGKVTTTFRGVPIRRVDQITSSEAGI